MRSVAIISALLIYEERAVWVNVTSLHSTVVAVIHWATSAAITLPGTTWYVSISCSIWIFSGLSSISTVPAGSLANAASVGANTVNGPSDERVSTSPASATAVTSVVWISDQIAISTTVSGIISIFVSLWPSAYADQRLNSITPSPEKAFNILILNSIKK